MLNDLNIVLLVIGLSVVSSIGAVALIDWMFPSSQLVEKERDYANRSSDAYSN